MKSRSMKSLAWTLLLLAAAPAWAFDIDRLQAVGQRDFRLLSEDVGAAISYHPQTPTEPLGVTGFYLGLSLTMSKKSATCRRGTTMTWPGASELLS